MAVLNAGVFPQSYGIAELETDLWDRVLEVNLSSKFRLLKLLHPILKHAPLGGRVTMVGSKNVPAPGLGAAAYSVSKSGLTELARVAALEWGGDGVRVNVVHPNAVFDTAIWNEEVLRQRAAHYGMTIDEYRRSNVLRIEVLSKDVAELVTATLGASFKKTTGAQIPVDGGNERVI